ncbi:DNA polymerase III subunit delta [Aquirhabdus parva]|uniref:DNA polymerase III subunit delta n=1 Tax=Aquirhabdus parva TaxID=2283318 RepID=A0A345P4M4_9GAMM|nr:DNA polymerase III subunit delta [Aquirhabdus parva]AXI02233.1 DNA polymerase III subunit delta [Aquirhabdus parva]
MKADYLNASKRISGASGAWLMHGDEPLLAQSLLDQCRKHWREQNIERQRVDLTSSADWREALGQLDNLSLFSSTMALEIHGNHKPDAAGMAALERFIQSPGDNILIINMPKQDHTAQKTKFFQLLDANGLVVSLALQNDRERQDFLATQAKTLKVELTPEAWKMLISQTENNLLAAHQALIRLSFLSEPDEQIDIEKLLPALSDQSRYSLFDLSDAALLGDIERTVKILNYLFESGEAESLILWTISKEMRLILQLLDNPNPNYQSLGIWFNRQSLYQKAMRRIKRTQTTGWLELLLRCDQSIKGVGLEKPKDLLLQASLALTGLQLFDTKISTLQTI